LKGGFGSAGREAQEPGKRLNKIESGQADIEVAQ